MAELTDINKRNSFTFKVIRYQNKNEAWFLAKVNLKEDENNINGSVSFNINDYVALTEGITHLLSENNLFFTFEFLEPYLKMIIKKTDNQFAFDIFYNKGPIFNDSGYIELNILTSKENMIRFINEVGKELRSLDPHLKLGKIHL
ncbi:MAG: WapI family immunity protein [Candidatus Levyibacteriota bacterium]